MELKIKPLSPKLGTEIPFPSYATPGAAAMDLRACIGQPLVLPRCYDTDKSGSAVPAWSSVLVPTGFAIALPGPEWVALIFPRSGLAAKLGLSLPNCVGVIDSDYRGEVKVALVNHGDSDYVIQPGERIAQMAVLPVAQARIAIVDALDDTSRGAGGFGSTGKV